MRTILLVVAMVVSGAAQQTPTTQSANLRTELSADFKEAGLDALEAIKRIPDVKLPDDGFEARSLDAEKALSAAKRKQKTDADKAAYVILVNWWSMAITRYNSEASGNIDRQHRAFLAEFSCSLEARHIFDPESVPDKFKKQASEKNCNAEAGKVREGP